MIGGSEMTDAIASQSLLQILKIVIVEKVAMMIVLPGGSGEVP